MTDPSAVWRDLTIPLPELLARVPRWLALLSAVTILPFVAIWGLPALPPLQDLPAAVARGLLDVLVFVAVYAVSAAVHEALHALGMVWFAHVPWRSIRARVRWREGIAYVHTDTPMTARAYRAVLVLPALVQGFLPALAALYAASGWLIVYAFVMLASSIGDFAVLRLMRTLPPDALVRDHPTRVGCLVRSIPEG